MQNFKTLKFILALLIMLSINIISQNKGSIAGKITDKSNNEELVGANVLIIGTTIGSSTDLDGFYSIRNLAPGKYQLRFSYISYQPVVVSDVVVESNKETRINISLVPVTTELEEVVVTAQTLKNTEANVLKIQRSSFGIVDGISAELISKNNSSDGTDILKSMTGVTISEGKFAYIRGVGDRYNNTLLNGANLPSTEPEKKSFSYDIFPASLIENVITAKTFTPDKPADFSGGLVQIKTVEFPSSFFVDINSSVGYNSNTSLSSFTSYEGGKKDWLGIDDGTRSLPSLISDTRVVPGNFQDNPEMIQEIGKSFKNNWSTRNVKAPLNGSFKLSFGDKFNIYENVLGYIASLTYSNSTTKSEIERNLYDFEGPRLVNDGYTYTNNVMWGGLLNLSYKFLANHKLSFKNIYNQNSDNETTMLEGENYYNTQLRRTTALRFVSRSLVSSQVIGEHYFNIFNGLDLSWMGSFSESERNEPDARLYSYWKDALEEENPWRFLMDPAFNYRFYSDLKDKNLGFTTDLKINIFERKDFPTFKIGVAFDEKSREFDARFFGFRNKPGGNFMREDSILQKNVEEIFVEANITPQFIEVIEVTKPSDKYSSKQNLFASYLMFDATLFENLKIIGGVRYEYSRSEMNTLSLTGEPIEVSPEYKDILPSINLTYSLTKDINLRLAYSRTLARPEFREMAPFSYFDFVAYETVKGNPELKRSLIQNYDFRFEFFPTGNELIAFSLFYKNFKDPIEQVFVAASEFNPIRSFSNAEKADNYGAELEVRKNLNFVSSYLNNFSFVGNASIIRSKIKLASNGNGNGSSFQAEDRAMQGQADFILNAGIYYDSFELGLAGSIVYNKVGEKIAKAGFADLGDVIEKPRDQIDLSVSQRFFERVTLKLTAKDILSQDHVFIQKSPKGDKTFSRDIKGNSYSVSVSLQL